MNQTETLETFTMTVGDYDYTIPARFKQQMEDIMDIDDCLALLARNEYNQTGKTRNADHATLLLYKLITAFAIEEEA